MRQVANYKQAEIKTSYKSEDKNRPIKAQSKKLNCKFNNWACIGVFSESLVIKKNHTHTKYRPWNSQNNGNSKHWQGCETAGAHMKQLAGM